METLIERQRKEASAMKYVKKQWIELNPFIPQPIIDIGKRYHDLYEQSEKLERNAIELTPELEEKATLETGYLLGIVWLVKVAMNENPQLTEGLIKDAIAEFHRPKHPKG